MPIGRVDFEGSIFWGPPQSLLPVLMSRGRGRRGGTTGRECSLIRTRSSDLVSGDCQRRLADIRRVLAVVENGPTLAEAAIPPLPTPVSCGRPTA